MAWESGSMNMNTLFRRCVVCPTGNTPPCPSCAADETCSLSILTCTACPSTSCIKTDSSGATADNGPVQTTGGFNAGAIAGGVVGGVIAIGILTYLVWRFCIKNRKQRYQEDDWVEEVSDEKTKQFHARRDARASTHTVGSIASTTVTRASNVIQIAYIPGVTHLESPSPSTPSVLVPPVPALPSYGSRNNSGESTPDFAQDQHFFMPSDLRDSTYSGLSENHTRGSYARTSLTPSLATTIYRHNAIVNPMPAQTVHLAKAAVVSVKSTGNNSPDDSPAATPPVPSVNYQRHGHRALALRETAEDKPPPSPAFSVGSTFLNSTASTAVHARPVLVTKPSRPCLGAASLAPSSVSSASSTLRADRPRISVASALSSHSRALRHTVDSTAFSELSADEDEDEEPHARSRRSLMRGSKVTVIEDTPAISQSPFRDPEATPSPTPSTAPPSPRRGTAQRSIEAIARHFPKIKSDRLSSGSNHSHKKSGSLTSVIEEATNRASKQATHGGLGSTKRGASPFDDSNAV